MPGDRTIRSRRRGLNPTKVVFVYSLAFILVCFHQSARVADWFDDLALKSDGFISEKAFGLSRFFRESLGPYGPEQFNRLEDRLLAFVAGQAAAPQDNLTAPAISSTAEPGLAETEPATVVIAPEEVLAEGPDVSVPAPEVPPPDQNLQAGGPELPAPERPDPPAYSETLSPSAAMARELILIGHLEMDREADEPYAELPPIYWSRGWRPGEAPANGDEEPANGPNESSAPAAVPDERVERPADRDEPVADDGLVTSLTASLTFSSDRGPATPPKSRKSINPSSVLLLGDSMMLEGLGPPLQRTLKNNEGLKVFRDGRYGTGLTRLDNFDWLGYFDEMLQKYEPDLVVLTIGANDAQDMVGGGRRVHLGTDAWNETYSARVSDLLKRAKAKGATVFWVGLPIMGREPYGSRVAAINKLAQGACEAADNCHFWDSWLSVADARGNYATYLTSDEGKSVRVRAKDNIHLTEAGGRLMADKFLADIEGWVDFQQREGSFEPADKAAPPLAPSAGDEDGDGPGFELTERRLWSAARNKETSYWLVRPQSPARQRFPLVVLLHGAWDGGRAWADNIGRAELLELARQSNLALLMPDGEPFGWYVDGRETAIESYLMDELLPRVLADFQEIDGGRIGISGLSMGGHGALTLTLKHPDIFKATGALSALTDLSRHAGRAHAVDPQLGLEAAFGEAGPDGRNWRPFSAEGLTESRPGFWTGRPLIISVGLGDSLTLAENRAFHQLLVRQAAEPVYREREGGHDWPYWRAELPAHLAFLSRNLR